MVSVPVILGPPCDDADPDTTFGDDITPLYFWTWDPGVPSYIHPTSVDLCQGYWIKVFQDTEVDANGMKWATDEYTVSLVAGWQQIGEPFDDNQTADLDSVEVIYQGQTKSLSDAHDAGWVSKNLWKWCKSPDQYCKVVCGSADHELEMWYGYWMRSYVNCVLKLYAGPPSPPLRTIGSSSAKGFGPSGEGWQVQLLVYRDGAADMENYLGVSPEAFASWDVWDVEEPPAAPDYVALYFPHLDWQMHPGLYASDIRSPLVSGQSEVWDMEVVSSLEGGEVTLEWRGMDDVPESCIIRLVDAEGGEYDMRRSERVSYICQGRGEIRHFQVRVSSVATGEVDRTDMFTPEAFGLLPNYPNPFNPETIIRYNIGRQSAGSVLVTLQVYNTLGQLVRTLVETQQPAGLYSVTWDGKDEYGEPVGSGVYIYRLGTEDHTFVKKMVLMK